VFLSAANGLRRSGFKKPADSHQYTLRQTQDALMDLWISDSERCLSGRIDSKLNSSC
jgi:hypothetical protein